jgi:hypothetical protein
MRAGTVGHAQAGAEVVRVGHAVEHQHQRRHPRGHLVEHVVERVLRQASADSTRATTPWWRSLPARRE